MHGNSNGGGLAAWLQVLEFSVFCQSQVSSSGGYRLWLHLPALLDTYSVAQHKL
jgi:hypothetical protein